MIQTHYTVSFSRREWKRIVYYYKIVIRPDAAPNKDLDNFNRYDRRGKLYGRTFPIREAQTILETLISSSILSNKRRDFLRSLRKQL